MRYKIIRRWLQIVFILQILLHFVLLYFRLNQSLSVLHHSILSAMLYNTKMTSFNRKLEPKGFDNDGCPSNMQLVFLELDLTCVTHDRILDKIVNSCHWRFENHNKV